MLGVNLCYLFKNVTVSSILFREVKPTVKEEAPHWSYTVQKITSLECLLG